mgnify:FL=1
MNNLPYGSGLSVCNSRNIRFLNEIGFEPLDGGAGKCKQLDSYFYDNLVSLGYRGRELAQNIEADWIVSSTKKCKNLPDQYGGESLLEAINNNNLIFSYINTNANGAAFFSMNNFFKVVGKKVTSTNLADSKNYTIKVGPSASKNLTYLLQNLEDYK